MPVHHHSAFFYKPDALPAAQPSVLKPVMGIKIFELISLELELDQ